MFAGSAAPANWLICNGQSLDTTAYATLFGVVGYAFGGSGANFNLPNLLQKFPLGAGPNPLGQAGGSFAVALATTNLPPHSHPAWQAAHSHYSYQDAHSHYVYQDVHTHADAGHAHGSSAYQDAHTHGGVITGLVASGGAIAGTVSGGNLQSGRTDNQQPGVHVGIATDYAHLDNRQPAVHADTQQPGVHVDTQTPAVATGNTGDGAAFSVVPPYLAINFIIRFQ
jgi:microcystin-dependent protein